MPTKSKVPEYMSIKHPGLRKLLDRRGDEILERRGLNRGKDCDEAEFFLCLVFQSNKQYQEFLEAIPNVPVLYNRYADGEVFAEQVGIPVSVCNLKPLKNKSTPIGRAIALKPKRVK